MPKSHTLPTSTAPLYHPTWTADNIPYSPQFDDIYYNKNNGLEESKHVFVNGNNLQNRFAATQSNFTIAELGFGTGLNLFLINDLWQKYAPKNAHLTYISFEKYPLFKEDIKNALTFCYKKENSEPEPQFLERFLDQYAPQTGWNTYIFQGLTLHLAIGDIADFLPHISQKLKQNQQVSAWLLDGFAPAKNPDMWTPDVFQHMAQATENKGTFATFTAAAGVRGGLTKVGFSVTKTKGYAYKRTMLVGTFHA